MSIAWVIIFLAIFFIGVTKSGFGSGVGLMIVPMATTAFAYLPEGSETALPLLLPLLVAGDILAIWNWRGQFNWTIIGRLLPGTIVGIAIGSSLLYWFNSLEHLAGALINIEIGCESVFLVALNWYREWRSRHGELVYKPSVVKSTAVGAFAGVSSTLAHAAGPIIALHLLPQRLERGVFVGTSAMYFFMVNSAKLPGYYASGLFAKVPPLMSLRFLPLVLAGAIFGVWLNRRINDRLFSKIVYIVTFILGWYVLGRGIFGLMNLPA